MKLDPDSKKSKAARFNELRRAAEMNAAANNLTEEEAIALVESIRQAIFEEGKREDFEAFLAAVPDADPIEEDRLD